MPCLWSQTIVFFTAEFVTSIGLKKWDGFLTFSTEFPKKKPNIAQEKSESAEMWEIQLIWAFWWKYKSGGGSFTNSAVAVEWL